jgi:cytochrome oxidase Cu insertion factor (SCO1/SenC/PrrC family)
VIRRSGLAILGAAVVMGLALAAPAASLNLGALDLEPYEPPKPAPVFSLPDLTGRTWNLADLRGKVVLIFFWATW